MVPQSPGALSRHSSTLEGRLQPELLGCHPAPRRDCDCQRRTGPMRPRPSNWRENPAGRWCPPGVPGTVAPRCIERIRRGRNAPGFTRGSVHSDARRTLMDVLAKHKVAGSTPVPRLHELGLRRGGRLVKDEERRWGSEDPFPAKWRLASPGAHEGGVSASRTWQGASKIGSDASPGGSPRPGRSWPQGAAPGFRVGPAHADDAGEATAAVRSRW